MTDVIDWDEAMEQCGDDEEFLRELLDDLRGEADTQVDKIEETIRSPTDNPFHRIMRASHVIKGAAANLMCHQLHTAAAALEKAASAGNDVSGDPNASASAMELVKARYIELKQANDNYHAYLQSEGI
mmetsp:Transcript_40345/g.49155  ORF Transcript_40345/g.49155 Transcript_40345/m.49155 type:complete len:128 (-) Transcript_40345:417-800(-)|eukprot:CAMPEP_0172514372 /NCGR_PEP_ID=MMETSP1066-20121228/259631_1 /TAXON_ID=671091 /ORGANISM="Coscinodiscus wailesii, Strain CCMP2513" /LENGTH=127 /DNA_ID=CAMNT_0013295011 /DNA_START=125 /DNA_END=508 /DNA_ORIENTATION=+